MIDFHKAIASYTIDDNYYSANGYIPLKTAIHSYAAAHSWLHYYATIVPDSNPAYFHYIVLFWSDGNRPTLNTFHFKDNV